MASIDKKFLGKFKCKLEQIVELLRHNNEEPEDVLFKSQNTARDLLVEVQEDIEEELEKWEENTEEKRLYSFLSGHVYYKMGQFFNLAGDLDTAREYLDNCVTLLEPWKQLPECIIPYMGSHILMAHIDERLPDHANLNLDSLEEAEDQHFCFKKSGLAPLTIGQLFGFDSENNRDLGVCELRNCFSLIFANPLKMIDQQSTNDFHFKTLQHQLEIDDIFYSCRWASQAMAMSRDFGRRDCFEDARHFLAAAQFVLDKYNDQIQHRMDLSEKMQAVMELEYRTASARLMQSWGYFGSRLLQFKLELETDGESLFNIPLDNLYLFTFSAILHNK